MSVLLCDMPQPDEVILKGTDVEIPFQEVYRTMGYGDAIPEEEIVRLTSAMIEKARNVARPRYVWKVIAGHIQGESLLSGECSFEIGKIISHQLRDSEEFVVFAATAGAEFDDWVDSLKAKDDMLNVFIADSIGSVLAECVADRIEESLQQQLSAFDLHHSNRYSPGYCGWHVSQQKMLFSLFGEQMPCAIRLTDSSLMLPVKSVSGIMGIGRKIKKLDYTCGLCDFDKCFRRKKKQGAQNLNN